MAREEFIDSLRFASRLLPPPTVSSGQGAHTDLQLSSMLHSADLWLTRKSVYGFEPVDFADWPMQDRTELAQEVAAFLEIADQVPANKPATKVQSKQARKHLEKAIKIVRQHLLPEWLKAQKEMLDKAKAAAKGKDWFFEEDEKDVRESLLGEYKAPRLRIRTKNRELVLDPIARFGSGRQGVVDLVKMPTYERVSLIAFKDGGWQIISPSGTLRGRPFTQTALVNTINKLSH